jgi:uncharacterized protein (TIGR01244 family)
MKMKAIYFSILIIILFANSANSQDCQASQDLPNFGCVNQHLFRGAQPTENGIKQLARRGVKVIINLRNDGEEDVRNEESWAKKAGLRYVNVPLSDWSAPKDSDIKEILRLINSNENQPVFVHCQRGANRTGTAIAIYRITHDGWTAKQAMDEAKNFKFRWWAFWLKKYIDNYSKNDDKSKVK